MSFRGRRGSYPRNSGGNRRPHSRSNFNTRSDNNFGNSGGRQNSRDNGTPLQGILRNAERPISNSSFSPPPEKLPTTPGPKHDGSNQSWKNEQQEKNQPNLREQAQKYIQEQQVELNSSKPELKDSPPSIVPKCEDVTITPVTPCATQEKSLAMEVVDEEEVQKKGRPAWVKNIGKINKKELRRRRNLRLRKILQPKNALMVLNELVGSTPYEVVDVPDPFNGPIFKCSVQVEGVEHCGVGKSKPAAKNAAAETALKHMVLNKVKTLPTVSPTTSQDAEGTEMKVDMEDGSDGISWSHVACYALHKLLNGWDEGNTFSLTEKIVQSGDSGDGVRTVEKKKPAKKLPDMAHTMNPVMLLNQMVPNAMFVEIAREGNPPNIVFTVKCTIENDEFFGSGSTKKGARKMCAFAACKKKLGIQYSPEFLEEQGYVEDSVEMMQ
ncbi:hypothetical protein FQA39_LY03681 [Lamprigera yunnana]|nr:hypothetical protein FQA39_LY03681 [Lamprigera yunnana]